MHTSVQYPCLPSLLPSLSFFTVLNGDPEGKKPQYVARQVLVRELRELCYQFLDAFSHLYKRVCPSVGRLVGRSVRPSVHRSVTHELKSRIWPILSEVMVQEGKYHKSMTNQATVRSTGTSISANTSTNTCTCMQENASIVRTLFDLLDASSHLYKRVCPSVRRFVRP